MVFLARDCVTQSGLHFGTLKSFRSLPAKAMLKGNAQKQRGKEKLEAQQRLAKIHKKTPPPMQFNDIRAAPQPTYVAHQKRSPCAAHTLLKKHVCTNRGKGLLCFLVRPAPPKKNSRSGPKKHAVPVTWSARPASAHIRGLWPQQAVLLSWEGPPKGWRTDGNR